MGAADKIVWYENDGAADPRFTANTVTSSAADSPNQVYAEDLDNDGDIDIPLDRVLGDVEGELFAWIEMQFSIPRERHI